MAGVDNQIVALLQKTDSLSAEDIGQRLGVSAGFVQSRLDNLTKKGRIVGSGARYARSQQERRRSQRFRCLEKRRRPFVRW